MIDVIDKQSAANGSSPRVACIMMQKDEEFLLEPWLAYHSHLCGAENLFVFDNGSTSELVRDVLKRHEQRGVNVDWSHASRRDYETKNQVIGDKVSALDALGRYDFLIPIDCDEFIALRSERNCSFRREDVLEYLSSLRGERRVLKFPYQLANHPLQPDIYHYFPFSKSFFAAGTFGGMDHGHHNGISRAEAGARDTRLIQIHIHYKRYDLMHAQVQRSWVGTVAVDDLEKLQNYKGPSVHVAPFLLAEPRKYYTQLRNSVHFILPEFRRQLEVLGAPLVLPTEVLGPDLSVQFDVADVQTARLADAVTVLIPPAVPSATKHVATRFDERLYLAANPDVAKVGRDPTVHFCRYGYLENRRLSPPYTSPDLAAENNDPPHATTVSQQARMSYAGLQLQTDATTPHLGGAVSQGDPYTFCPSVWDYMIARFAVSSVLDLGSGCGNASRYFHRKGLYVVAVEGLWASVERSFYPSIQHDLTTGPVRTHVDLVHCQEVVEHIEAQYIDHVMDSLLTGRVILITHALPGQGGHHHVNLQPPDYWIGHFTRRGCVLLDEDTSRVRALAAKDGARYVAATGMVFANRERGQN